MGSWGLMSLLWFAVVVYAVVQIVGTSIDTANKILWVLIVLLFPIGGVIVWFFIGPGSPRA